MVTDNEQKECINEGCHEPRERVITLYGGVAAVCEEHAEERLKHPDAIDNTAFFKGEREKPINSPAEYRSLDTDNDHAEADHA